MMCWAVSDLQQTVLFWLGYKTLNLTSCKPKMLRTLAVGLHMDDGDMSLSIYEQILSHYLWNEVIFWWGLLFQTQRWKRGRERERQTAVCTRLRTFLCKNHSIIPNPFSALLVLHSYVSALLNKCVLGGRRTVFSLNASASSCQQGRVQKGGFISYLCGPTPLCCDWLDYLSFKCTQCKSLWINASGVWVYVWVAERRNSVGCFSPFSIYIKTLSASEEKGVFRHHVMFSVFWCVKSEKC